MHEPIAPRFSDVVSLHVIANFQLDAGPGTPLILTIQGPSGEGKTFQVERTLNDAGIHTVLLSGGELESSNAGAPAARVRGAYLEAGGYIESGIPSVVLLNDADAAIGKWSDTTQYTVNTQNLITELMHLADYPTRVEGKRVRRVPVILTGNDFTRVYAPLRRNGRMRIFSWSMEPAERASAVRSLFPWLTPEQASELVGYLPDEVIAFWADVRRRMDDIALTDALRKHGLKVVSNGLIAGRRVFMNDDHPAFEDVMAVAKSMAEEKAHDFLRP